VTATSPDRALTTLAILKVNQEEGRRHLDSYQPFVLHCLSQSTAAEISTSDLQSSLLSEFGVELPQAVLKRLLDRLKDAGKVHLEHGVFVVDRAATAGDDLGAVVADAERCRGELVNALRSFAQDEFNENWTEEIALDQLFVYTEGFSSMVLAAALTGEPLQREPAVRDSEQFIVHRFAAGLAAANQTLFEHLLTFVKGRMLADALSYFSDEADEPPSLDKVEVYLDGPPLLFVLGYAGAEMQGPYAELLEMLKRQGAIVRCFEHSLTEAREILDAAAVKARTGQSNPQFHGDVVSHLIRSGRSPVEIELLANRLPNDLLKLAINPVPTPARRVHLQPDENALAERLQGALRYGNRTARDRDIDSLTAIYRIRGGRAVRDLEKCKAIFATHNFNLFRTSTAFFRVKDRHVVPACAYDMSLATMLWLREPNAEPDLPRERVIAQAYAALDPDDRLWGKYNAEIEHLRQDGHLDEEDAQFLRYGREAQEALMDETRGDHEAFTEGTLPQVLARARENMLAETQAELAESRAATARANQRLARTAKRIHGLAAAVGEGVATAGFVLAAIAILVGTVFGPVGPADSLVSGPIQILCAVAALSATVVTMFFSPALLDYRNRAATAIGRELEELLLSLFRLRDNRPDE
jgi:hypothetical protein